MSFPDFFQSAGNCLFLVVVTAVLTYVGYEMLKALIDDMIRNRF